MKPFTLVLYGMLVATIVAVAVALHHQKPAPMQPVSDCAALAHPCIEMVDAKGVAVARFNDFRFCGQNCINYETEAGWKQYRGAYTLKWIGPPTLNKMQV